jgi:hypothetical protein
MDCSLRGRRFGGRDRLRRSSHSLPNIREWHGLTVFADRVVFGNTQAGVEHQRCRNAIRAVRGNVKDNPISVLMDEFYRGQVAAAENYYLRAVWPAFIKVVVSI